MGLDAVELVMAIEDEFDIAVPDAVAAEMATIGQTVQKIVELLRPMRAPASGACGSARSFYRLRRELIERFGVPRGTITLDTPIGMLVPPSADREWPRIADAAGLWRERNEFFKGRFPAGKSRVREWIESPCKTQSRR